MLLRFGGSSGRARRSRVAVASWAVVSLVTASVVVLAVRSEGVRVQKAHLDDGGVWVTNSAQGYVGRVNKPIQQLDLSIAGTAHETDQVDVLQNEQAVVAFNGDGNLLTPIDADQGTADAQGAVAVKSADVHLGGNVVAVDDPATGKLWATQVSTSGGATALSTLDATSKPVATSGARSRLTVTRNGTVLVASAATGRLTSIETVGAGFGKPTTTRLTPRPSGSILDLTAVGDRAVWLDSAGRVGFAGHRVEVGRDAKLQQVGSGAASVLVETASKLVSIDLDSGRTTTLLSVAGTTTPSAPVALGGCAWGLWSSGSQGIVKQRCGSRTASRDPFPVRADAQLVYRVNRTALLVNDRTNGPAWDVDGAKAQQVANWQSLQPKTEKDSTSDHQVLSQQPAKPQAVKDELGARAGDTTVLHVLDNDKAPADDTLAITDVQSTSPQVTVSVAPDQQTILARVNQGVASGTVLPFTYTIDDGEKSDSTATGNVALTAHSADDPAAPPALRENFDAKPAPTYPVASGHSIDVPVLADWRDRTNGDPVSLVPGSAKVNVGTVSITPDGLLRYVAPPGAAAGSGAVSLTYQTTTGGQPNRGTVGLRIYSGTDTAPPVAQPDVAAGDVGNPIVVTPLDNDIAGADPVDPTAALDIAGNVAPQPGLSVHTDLGTGTVTVVGQRPGSYSLSYRAGFGSAAGTSPSTIRVLVRPSSKASTTPVAMPDTAAVHGSAPVVVDVLANDFDPQGRLLAVQGAAQSDGGSSHLDVAVVKGRWLRVTNPSGEAQAKPQVVNYTLTNGLQSVPGTLTVSLLAPIEPADDAPDAQPDTVTVRAGASVDIPVLENDSTPSGDPVALVGDTTSHAGTVPITTGGGRAYLDGKYVRFVAPTNLRSAADTYFSYTVENASQPDAGVSSGAVTVHVTPPVDRRTNPDHAPTPSELTGRVVEGDTVTMRLPLTGQDPDGDTVSITAIGDPATQHSTPQLGQVTSFGGDTVSYQAFPGQTGEDRFSIQVTDPSGQTTVGTARVAVVAPSAPQAPVAVDDSVTVDPSRTLTMDVLANDLYPQGTTPTVVPLRSAPAGVEASGGEVVVAPASRSAALSVPYTITNGLADSSARLQVRFKKGFDNPPNAGRVTAAPLAGSDAVTTNVLAKVTDVDDDLAHLTLASVDGLPASAIHGASVTLPVSSHPRVWTYRVRDSAGAQAVGSIYEAGRPDDVPFLKRGSVLHLPTGAATTVDITRYVVSPKTGTQPYLTTDDQIFTAPTGEFTGSVRTPTQQSIKVTTTSASGPATLSFQVSDRKDFNSPGATTAMITLPVVVGHPEPTLTCPTDVVPIPESGRRTLQVGAVCHVWQDPTAKRTLSYTASIPSPVSGISARSDGSGVVVTATHAKPGAQGVVQLGIKGTRTQAKLPFVVTKLPPPTMLAIPVQHPQGGQSVKVNLAAYLQSGSVPADAFAPAVVGVQATNGGPKASFSGTTVTIAAPKDKNQTFTYAVRMSDSGAHAGADRIATGVLRVQVTDVPHWSPGATIKVVDQVPQAGEVTLTWPGAIPYGTPVSGYTVTYAGRSQACGATTCTITGLTNGQQYSFTVTAQSADGDSKPIGPAVATPDAVPTAVTAVTVTAESDGHVTYSWDKPSSSRFSAVTGYLVSWTGHDGYQQVAAQTQQVTVPNGQPITFSVRPYNELYQSHQLYGPPTSNTVGVASGRPQPTAITGVSGTNVAGGGTKAFVVTWGQVDPNGRGSSHYELLDNGAPVACGGGDWTASTQCTDQVPNNGSQHAYTVITANDAGVPATANPALEGAATTHQSAPSAARTVTAAGTPDGFSSANLTPTGTDGEANLTFTVGASNGAKGTVTCTGDFACGTNELGPSGGSRTVVVRGLTNGSTSNGTLHYCNGANADSGLAIDPCVTTTVSATTYGPIGTPTITANANATTVTVNANVDPNGAPVSMTIRNDTTGATHGCGNASGRSFPCSWSDGGLAYSTTYHYTVTVDDASGHGRAQKSAAASATTPAAPPPQTSVAVTPGPNRVVVKGVGSCTRTPGCPEVLVSTSGFTSGVNCVITAATGGTGGFIPWKQAANEANHNSGNVQANGSVTVQCTDGQGNTKSGTGNW